MVTVVKPNKIRICMDPQDLNKTTKHEHSSLLTLEEVVSSMPNAKIFPALNANQGFWQVKLDDKSLKLKFNMPIGKYRFLHLPFGVSLASEVFQHAKAQMLESHEGVVNITDDILVWRETTEEHDHRLIKLLERAKEWNLKLNKSKSHQDTSSQK